ncbi:MAG TPA: PIN domain-containing protein [Spirochaetes bacterium]|nr:PIN domain-containing protein [Spirochaetota bacterium]
MTLSDELHNINTIFIDTTPIIYYIEDHQDFAPLMTQIVNDFQSDAFIAYSSVITLTEVLPKPIQKNQDGLAVKFSEFLRKGKNFNLIEISENIAEKAGRLRGKYLNLKALDAIQLASAISLEVDAFLSNDKKLKQVNEIKVLLLKDYL